MGNHLGEGEGGGGGVGGGGPNNGLKNSLNRGGRKYRLGSI